MATSPAGSFGHADPLGGGLAATVTLTLADVLVLPAASRATAVSVWVPADAAEAFHTTA